MKTKVAVGLSGGVDSAVSAALLRRAGYEVVGVYLHCFPESYQKTLGCTDKEDFKMAQKVSQTLKIPFTFFDFEKDYQEKVINYFFQEYEAGRTPNPDTVCNKEIKFGLFLDRAIGELGVDFVATGHYARIISNGAEVARQRFSRLPIPSRSNPTLQFNLFVARKGSARKSGGLPALDTRRFTPNNKSLHPTPYTLHPSYHLLSGIDPTKDQSYFLYNLSQEQLSRVLFPVGEYTKKQVRQMARDFGLPNWDRKDSQGICFLGKVSVRKFLEQRIKPRKGKVVDTSGRVIGEHDGAWFYTIGQRHGFRISAKLNPSTSLRARAQNAKLILPLYVIDKDVENNRLIVGWGKECERKEFLVEKVNWINELIKEKMDCKVRIRHLGELYPCRLKIKGKEVEVVLKEPAWGVAPGQVAVFYLPRVRQLTDLRGDGEEVLGGGVIARSVDRHQTIDQ